MKKILPLLAVLSLATACIYPYQPDLEEAPEGVLVVDGNLVLGEMSTVYVGSMSSLWPGPDDARPKIPVKRVWAEDDAGGAAKTMPGQIGITAEVTVTYAIA